MASQFLGQYIGNEVPVRISPQSIRCFPPETFKIGSLSPLTTQDTVALSPGHYNSVSH